MESYKQKLVAQIIAQWKFSLTLAQESPNENQFLFNYFYLKGELSMAKYLPLEVFDQLNLEVTKYRVALEELWKKWFPYTSNKDK